MIIPIMYPVLLHLGPLTIYSYGTMMAIAFLTAAYLTGKELKRKGLPESAASTMVFWAAVGGLVGARVLAILEDVPEFLHDPLRFIFSGAGFVWYGGLIGGFVAVTLIMRRLKLPFLRTVDCIAPALALGHAIGRIGCQLAGDGDWGKVSTLPWAMAYPHAIIGWNYPPGVRVHPAPVYETIAYTIVFGILWSIRKRPHADGTLFWWYLIMASAARFLIEFVRINHVVAVGLTLPQLMSLGFIAIGIWRILVAVMPAEETRRSPVRSTS
jgi:phosphatidylglycerol---prolipoprotein diacylglyceryl transferase